MNLWLPAASANAAKVDQLIWALLSISLAVLALVFGLMFRYIVKYRAGSPLDRGVVAEKTWRIETAWTAGTLLVFFGLFVWGADLYVRAFQPPRDVLEIYVIGKQWMWKVEHVGGQREINALHIPTGRPIELVMTSEDVIHDFSVPAFRLKHDVLPDRYEILWFIANRPGTYSLYCTQFCGLNHSKMTGEVVVLPPPEFQAWLAQNGGSGTLAAEGQVLFMRYGCSGCHGGNGRGDGGDAGRSDAGGSGAGRSDGQSAVRAPSLLGLYGSPVPLSDGTVVVADDRYIHDSIVRPQSQIVAGFAPLMPSFAGQIGEEDLVKLIAYIKSLAPERPL
ncbi:MAG TPA: cytochrome c oxidase subunit II [Steroidobacteraceae bacterium]